MNGFSWWPARLCALYEELDLEQLMVRRPSQIGMLFFEKKAKKCAHSGSCTVLICANAKVYPFRSWINDNCVKEFTLSTLVDSKSGGLFMSKQFASSAVYRSAVIEATRIVLGRMKSDELDNTALAAIAIIRKQDPVMTTLRVAIQVPSVTLLVLGADI
jgi:hypothetical protein